MAAAAKHAEVVARDPSAANRLRDYLEGLDYSVGLKAEVEPEADRDRLTGADVIIYDVSPEAARAERRRAVRPGAARRSGGREYWMETLHRLALSAPGVPILVTLPAGVDAADAALASGATDVIQGTVTLLVIRRRLEMLEAFRQRPGRGRRARLAPSASASASGSAPPAPAPGPLAVPLPALRSASGRIDARKVAEHLGVPLRHLAQAMGLPYAGVHKTPDAARVQQPLAPFVRVLELAEPLFGAPEAVRMWLNRPLPELEDESPLAVMLAGEAGAVETLLANARAGIPG